MHTATSPAHRLDTTPPVVAPTPSRWTLHQRAALDGLDVDTLPFDAWLVAGGERRHAERQPTTQR